LCDGRSLKSPATAPAVRHCRRHVGYGIASDPLTENSFNVAFPVLMANSANLSVDDVTGGGQIGYNWQTAPNWLVGFEADFQGSGQRGSAKFTNSAAIASVDTVEVDNDWFGTVRGRVGYIQDNINLWYVTGGLAYGRDELKLSQTNLIFPINPAAGTITKTNTGWTLGGGVESHLFGNWTGKIEYLYVDLGTISGTSQTLIAPGVVSSGITASVHLRDNIVRVGLNYKF
jgi:outer membrane immunogenic protein